MAMASTALLFRKLDRFVSRFSCNAEGNGHHFAKSFPATTHFFSNGDQTSFVDENFIPSKDSPRLGVLFDNDRYLNAKELVVTEFYIMTKLPNHILGGGKFLLQCRNMR
jgi:hypothetical protein